jgi:hypothetical protein
VKIAGIGIAHPDKVLFPDAGITKADLARYDADVAPAQAPVCARTSADDAPLPGRDLRRGMGHARRCSTSIRRAPTSGSSAPPRSTCATSSKISGSWRREVEPIEGPARRRALDRRLGFDDVRAFARDVATVLAAKHPDVLTTQASKTKRDGRLYIDAMRNAYAATAVAPYAVRARRARRWRRRFDGTRSPSAA